jgi:hypothetical protein
MSQPPSLPQSVLNGPALRPPPGEVPDFEHAWNLNDIAEVANLICVVATTFAILVRAYAKAFCQKKMELEDVLGIIGMGTYFGSVWCSYRIIHTSGAFTHQWNIRLKDLGPVLYVHHIGANLCTATLGIGKSAILIEWNRIFVPMGTRNSFYWICKALLAFTVLTHIAYIVTENMSCIPHEKIWDRTILQGYCIEPHIFQIPGALVNPIVISFILVLPHRAIWGLQMSTKNKIGISVIFLVGLLALASSIFRAVKTFEFLNSDDKTHTISGVYLWTLAEMTCQFLAFCAPSIPIAFANKGILRRFFTSLFEHVGGSKGASHQANSSPSWPSSQRHMRARKWDASRLYHQIKDPSVPLVRTHQSATKTEQDDDGLRAGGGILMTTHFTAEITVAAKGDSRNSPPQEYPWNRN